MFTRCPLFIAMFTFFAAPFAIAQPQAGAPLDQSDEPARPWWRDAVFYQVFVRSFQDATHGPFAGDGKGDLQGLIDRLDYLNDGDPATTSDLGITALWLMPICESETYHGYDIEDYRKVDSELGTNELFIELMDECHKRGIRVITDWVMNHSSWKHPWFRSAVQPQSADRGRYIFRDPRPTSRGPWGQNVWHDNARGQSGQSYYGVFSHTMPDLNLRDGRNTRDLHNAAEYWLTDLKADGFRLDAIKFMVENFPDGLDSTPETLKWLSNFRDHAHAANPDAFIIGEVWDNAEVVQSYIKAGAVDSAFEFDLSFKLIDALNSGDATELAAHIAKLAETYDAAGPMGGHIYSTFLSNHDQARVLTRLGGDVRKARLAAAIQMTLPGTPFIYYGEELGMTGDKPDPDIRTPMPWSDTEPNAGFTTGEPWRALNDDPAAVSVPVAHAEGGLGAHYRELIRTRHRFAAVRSDAIGVSASDHPAILSYWRDDQQNEAVSFTANLSDQRIQYGGQTLEPYEFVEEILDIER